MTDRIGSAIWKGDLSSGAGQVTIGEDVWTGSYSAYSRLHDVLRNFGEGPGTNPEAATGA